MKTETKLLKAIDEKLRILILLGLGYNDNQRKQIKYFMEMGLDRKQIADLLKKELSYISKEMSVIKKDLNNGKGEQSG